MDSIIYQLKRTYSGMKNRCFSPKNPRFKNYGARGITICSDWLGGDGYKNFEKWALSNGFSEGLTLDRIDVNKDYTPDNCRFVDMKTQQRNKTNTLYVGKEKFSELVEEVGIADYRTAYARYFVLGWSLEKALYTPMKKPRKFQTTKQDIVFDYFKFIEMCNKKGKRIKDILNNTNVKSATLYSWKAKCEGKGGYYPKTEKIMELSKYLNCSLQDFCIQESK
jgi:hypothetical protein